MSIMGFTLGPMVAFCVASTVLSGVLTVQVYTYHVKFPQDGYVVKSTVWIVFILELLHDIFVWVGMYDYLLIHYGDAFSMNWAIIPATFFQATISCVVQIFYARRCWLLNRKHWIVPLVTVILSLASLGAGYYAGVATIWLTTFISYKSRAEIVWMGVGGLADILIIFSFLSSVKGPTTGYKPLDRGLNNLSVYIVSTGSITTIVNFVTMALFYTTKGTFWGIGTNMILSRLYSISLMASLNLRGTWMAREYGAEDLAGTLHNPWFKSRRDPTSGDLDNCGDSPIEIAPPSTSLAKYVA